MEKPAFIFSFCPEDQQIVDRLTSDLDGTQIKIFPDPRQGGNINAIAKTIQIHPGIPVFLLISDRFLKSEISMDKALEFVSEIVPEGQLQLVIDRNEEIFSIFGGQALWSDDLIAYYNHFWDETYSNLRQRKDQIAPGELETYNWRVRVIRNINDSISEFLHTLSRAGHISLAEFEADSYTYLFRHFNLDRENEGSQEEVAEEVLEVNKEAGSIGSRIDNPEKAYLNFLETGAKEDEQSLTLNGNHPLIEDNEDIEVDDQATETETETETASEKNPGPEVEISEPKLKVKTKKKKRKNKKTRCVLITGATSGIGAAIAKKFAKKGYALILTGRREDRLKRLKKTLKKKFKTRSKLLQFDIRDHEAVASAGKKLAGKWEEIDILINNAGLAKGFDPIHEGSLDHWDTMIDTNVKGLLYITRIISGQMVKRGKGHIINVGSIAGKEVYPNGNVYCASKHAVDALTRAMRIDLFKHGIKVGSVSPGHVETEFALVRFDGDKERSKVYEDFQPLRAKDIAETVYFMVTRPKHVNIQDVVIFSAQQASANHVDRSGRKHK